DGRAEDGPPRRGPARRTRGGGGVPEEQVGDLL
ncbi:MAG: hypothetical protein AVDCRST_MAG66-4826, partial [uncultured Pseudonocardia sp.]